MAKASVGKRQKYRRFRKKMHHRSFADAKRGTLLVGSVVLIGSSRDIPGQQGCPFWCLKCGDDRVDEVIGNSYSCHSFLAIITYMISLSKSFMMLNNEIMRCTNTAVTRGDDILRMLAYKQAFLGLVQ